MWGWQIIPPCIPKTKSWHLAVQKRDWCILLGRATECQQRLLVISENNIVMKGKCWWRLCKSCFITVASSKPLTFPKSFPLQWRSRTSGGDLVQVKLLRRGITECQLITPQPNHSILARLRPRVAPSTWQNPWTCCRLTRTCWFSPQSSLTWSNRPLWIADLLFFGGNLA